MLRDEEGNAVDPLPLLDFRRRVVDGYAAVRERLDAGEAAAAHATWAALRLDLLRSHPMSPVPEEERADVAVTIAPYDPDFALVGVFEPDPAAARSDVATSGGGGTPMVRVGTVRTDLGDLDAFWVLAYGGGLFVAFRDPTNGTSGPHATYGGGRYVLDTVKGADLGALPDGRLRLDLNFAYHPSCAFAPAWSCPLALRDAALAVPVTVGEALPR